MGGCVDARVCVCLLCVGGCLCVSVIKLASKSGFLCFLHVFVSYAFCLHTCVRVCACVFRVIAVLRLFFECLSLFVAEATFLSKSKLSWRNCLWTVQKKCGVFFFFFCAFEFLCTHVLCSCVCVCPRERAIKGAVWWRDCIKGAREETEWQAAERAACGGGRGADAGA